MLKSLAKLGAKASGVNWYLFALKAAVVIGLAIGLYACGSHNATVKCEEQKAELATKKAEQVIRYVEVKVPEIQVQTREVIKWKQSVENTGSKLNEAIEAQPSRVACGLSPDELRYFNEQAKATR